MAFDPHYCISTLGLSDQENKQLEKLLPNKTKCQMYITDDGADLMVIHGFIIVARKNAIDEAGLDFIFRIYDDCGEVWSPFYLIGGDESDRKISSSIKTPATFEEFLENAKFAVLEAYSKMIKLKNISDKLKETVRVLAVIRKNPGITTKELAAKIKVSEKTILRDIETLRAASEDINYSRDKHGWELTDNKSMLLGDYDLPSEKRNRK